MWLVEFIHCILDKCYCCEQGGYHSSYYYYAYVLILFTLFSSFKIFFQGSSHKKSIKKIIKRKTPYLPGSVDFAHGNLTLVALFTALEIKSIRIEDWITSLSPEIFRFNIKSIIQCYTIIRQTTLYSTTLYSSHQGSPQE